MDKQVYDLDTFGTDTGAIIASNVLNHRYAALRFEAVEDGCGGYTLMVAHMNQPEVKPEVIEKLKADIALIRDTIQETVRVKIWGVRE